MEFDQDCLHWKDCYSENIMVDDNINDCDECEASKKHLDRDCDCD